MLEMRKLTSSAISSINNHVISTFWIIPALKKVGLPPFLLTSSAISSINAALPAPSWSPRSSDFTWKNNSRLNIFSANCRQRDKGTRTEVLLADTNRLDSQSKISTFREIVKKYMEKRHLEGPTFDGKSIKKFTFFLTKVNPTNKYIISTALDLSESLTSTRESCSRTCSILERIDPTLIWSGQHATCAFNLHSCQQDWLED